MSAHLICCLGRSGFGEPSVGLQLAWELLAAGDQVAVVTDPNLFKVFEGAPFPVHVLPPEGWGRIEPVFVQAASIRPATIVLADYVMAMEALASRKVSPHFLHSIGARLVFVDTWHACEIGDRLEAGADEVFHYDPGFAAYPHRIVPVPFVRPDAPGGFSILPHPPPADPVHREGLGPDDKLLFLATSLWSHQSYADRPAIEAVRRAIPPRLASLLRRLDARTHLVHVGPQPLGPLQDALGARYRWHQALPAPAFRSLLASVDAVLSLNAAATSNALAIAAGVPVVTLDNPYEGDVNAIEAAHGALTPASRDWLAATGPIYPFAMWPYSMWTTLDPLLTDNPYGALLHRTPIVDGPAVVERLQGMLYDGPTRDAAAHAARRYAEQVRALPSGADRIRATLTS